MKKLSKKFQELYFFFPLQLFLETFRRNYTLILTWLLLFLFITKEIGYRYGIYALFLAPEYLEHVNFLSYLILGFTIGIFIMAYHMSSYITNVYLFPVVSTFRRPFLRYSLNNFIIPVGFIITYLVDSIKFQHTNQLLDYPAILVNISFFLIGITLFYLLTFGYFQVMNHSLERIISLSQGKLGQWKATRPLQKLLQQDLRWKTANAPLHNIGDTRVGYYLVTPFRFRHAPLRIDLPPATVQLILNRNRTFAVVFALILLISLTVIGIYLNKPVFAIPAAASIILLFSMALLVYDMFYVLFKDYAIWFFLALLLLIFYIINAGIIVNREGQAYGLNYNRSIPEKQISFDPAPGMGRKDYYETLAILNRWKRRLSARGDTIPRLVVVNNCGGGLKAALWSYYVMAHADSLMNHRLWPHVELLTGASGGMIGAAYLRELYLRKAKGYAGADSITARFHDLGTDMLNPVALHLALKDWFISFQEFEYNDNFYRQDRGWALENKLNMNTGSILDKPLESYRTPEEQALIPLMFLTPTTLNNGRQLLISPIHTAYMYDSPTLADFPSVIEFLRAYQPFGGEHLRFTSALRLNAGYPFITPVVTMPGEPSLKITDAGFRDNFGYLSSLRFLYVFRNWINQNTGGVVFISVGIDKPRKKMIQPAYEFIAPFKDIYGDFFHIQQLNGQELVHALRPLIKVDFDVIRLDLDERNRRISLSWHLTNQEKQHIKASIHSPSNRKSLDRLRHLIDH